MSKFEDLKEALNDFFSDDSIPQEDTAILLQEISEEIDILIDSIR